MTVEIKQCDREAVNAFHKESLNLLLNGKPDVTGAYDLLCQAFARHRIAAEQRKSEPSGDVAKMREALRPFARLADEIEQLSKQTGHPVKEWAKSCSWDDLVRARNALSTLPQEQRQEAVGVGYVVNGSFRKKPVVVEAVQWTENNAEEIQAFLMAGEFAANGWVKGRYVEIGTPEGLMVASPGDWIIRGVKGEHYPCKPDIFTATYEPVISTPKAEGEK